MRTLTAIVTTTLCLLAVCGMSFAETFSRQSIPPRSIGGKNAQDQKAAVAAISFIREHLAGTQPELGVIKLYGAGGLKGYRLSVYGVRNPADQDRIVQLLKDNAPKNGWKPISIIFFDRENLVSERGGYRRKDEIQIFSTVIE